MYFNQVKRKQILRRNITENKCDYSFNIYKIDLTNYFEIYVGVGNKKKKKYTFEYDSKTLNRKKLNDFIYFFIYDPKVREDIESSNFDYLNLPSKKTVEHLKKTSLPFNVKKVNEGHKKNINNLKIWNDEYSYLKNDELISFVSKEDQVLIIDEITKLRCSKENHEKMIRSVYRWCIRGLITTKAIEKEIKSYELSKYIINKKCLIKRKSKR